MGYRPPTPTPAEPAESLEFTPSPINRIEKILSGEDIKPLNRMEYFLKRAGSNVSVVLDTTGNMEQISNLGLSYADVLDALKAGRVVSLIVHTKALNINDTYKVFSLESLTANRTALPAKYRAYFSCYDVLSEEQDTLVYTANSPEDELILDTPEAEDN